MAKRRAVKKTPENNRGIFSVAKLMIEIILLVLALVLLFNIVKNFWIPYEQQAHITAQAMASAIDRACAGDTVSDFKLELNQPRPVDFAGTVKFLPKYMMKTTGDPYFVIYYENFPVGEAIDWEVYDSLKRRAIVPIDSSSVSRYNSANDYLTQIFLPDKTDYAQVQPGNTVINNILLDDVRGQQQYVKNTTENIPGSVGKWEEDTYYKFLSYTALTMQDKTAIKYRTCADNALCLKTRDGVYVYPLKNCALNGYDYIQLQVQKPENEISTMWELVKDAGIIGCATSPINCAKLIFKGGRGALNLGKSLAGGFGEKAAAKSAMQFSNIAPWAQAEEASGFLRGVGGVSTSVEAGGAAAGTGAAETATVTAGIGTGATVAIVAAVVVAVIAGGAWATYEWGLQQDFDFYITSPCSGKLKIEPGTCQCEDSLGLLNNIFAGKNVGTNWDIYQFNTDHTKLEKVGQHTACLHRFAGTENGYQSKTIDKCIKITLEQDSANRCVSDNIIFGLGFNPVTDTTEYVRQPANAFVLKETAPIEEKNLLGVVKLWWSWPS